MEREYLNLKLISFFINSCILHFGYYLKFKLQIHHWRKCNRDGWGDRPTSEGWEHFSRNNFDNGNYSVFNKSLIITNVKLSMIWQYACFHLIWSVWMIFWKTLSARSTVHYELRFWNWLTSWRPYLSVRTIAFSCQCNQNVYAYVIIYC